MVQTSGSTYAAVAMILWFGWPFFLLMAPRVDQEVITLMIVAEAIAIGTFVLNYMRCSSRVVSYYTGLTVIGAAWRTGLLQLSMMIATPILLLAHVLAVLLSLAGLVLGKHWTERAYLRLCFVLCRGNFHLEKSLAALTPPPPSFRVE